MLTMHRTFVTLLIGLCSHTVQAVSPIVDVGYTKYEGSPGTNGITQWLGIRFAAPPLGDLRYAAPADPLKNDTTQLADKVGDISSCT
jgi:carboxylesterase type B